LKRGEIMKVFTKNDAGVGGSEVLSERDTEREERERGEG